MKLEIKNLNKSYDFVVFDNLNLSFDSNLIHLSGPNGSGKSTLLKILSGKINYDSGLIYIDSKLVTTTFLADNSVLIDQDINLFLNESVINNIKRIAGKSYSHELITKFGFENEISKKVRELSGGYKKKLMIIIALMIKPKILLLDEYSSYLDIESLKLINEFLIEYSKDNMVIYVDHNDSLNGIIKNINDNDLINEGDNKKNKHSYSFKYRFGLFEFFSLLILMIFIICSQVSVTFNNIKTQDIIANYINDNNLWLQPVDETFDLEYKKYYTCHTRINDEIRFVTYTNDEIPLLKESSIKTDNSCYVFSNLEKYYETYIPFNGKDFFVKGIIDLNIDKYYNNEIYSTFSSIVIKEDSPKRVYITFVNAKNDAMSLYKNKKTVDYFYFHNNTYYDYKDLYKIIIFFSLIFMAVSVTSLGIRKKKEFNILNSYKNSNTKLFVNESFFTLLNLIFNGIVSYIGSYYFLYLIYKKTLPQFNVTFMRPFEIILIGLFIYFITYIISLYFIAVKKKKSVSSIE